MKRLALLALAAACGGSSHPNPLSTTEQAITGARPGYGLAGLVLITTPDGVVHTGSLVAPSLVLTATSVVRGQYLGGITVEYGVDLSHPTGALRHVAAQVQHPVLQAVYLQLDSAYAANQPTLPIDARDPSMLTTVSCFGYDQNRQLWRADLQAGPAGSFTFPLQAGFFGYGSVSDGDGGIPCLDIPNGGVVSGVTFSANTEMIAQRLGDWLPVATELGPIAAQSDRFSLQNANGKCLDVAWGGMGDGYGVNQYTCTGSYNQLWYFDYRGPHPTIVSANSGKCLDAPNGWMNTPLQQYTCNGGRNQQFEWYWFNPGLAMVSQISDRWWSDQSSSACLSVTGGSLADSASTELRSCSGGNDQRWSIEWR